MKEIKAEHKPHLPLRRSAWSPSWLRAWSPALIFVALTVLTILMAIGLKVLAAGMLH